MPSEAVKPINLYVAINGRDSWSGTIAAPNARKTDGPFATVQRARDAIRELRAKEGLKSPINVQIRGGTYYLKDRTIFGPEDSGTKDYPITYSAYRGEKPILSGGRVISGWQEAKLNGKNVWVADLPSVRAYRWRFRQLFVNGERRPRPRLPKEGYYQVAGLLPKDSQAEWNRGQNGFLFADGDIKPWSNLKDVEIVVLHFWVDSHLPIASVDEENHVVQLGKESVFRLTASHSDVGAPYSVENVLEAMDTPGQWYLDRKAGRLYYMPKPGERMDNCEIVAPRLAYILRLESDEKSKVEYLNFRGLSFAHAEWDLPRDSAGAWQAGFSVPGALFLHRAQHCEISDCEIAHIGNYGIELSGECEDVNIAGNRIHDMGGGGVKVGNDSSRTIISDNEIGDGGKIFHSSVGVWIGHSGHNKVVHNHIHHLFYSGISVGWTWGYSASKAVDNEITDNYIHHVGQGVLSDLGGIYTLGVSPGTVLLRNLIHDSDARTYGGWGIYLDEGSSLIRVEDNIVYRTKSGGFHQHYGKDNLIRNNIFAFAKEGQVIRSREEPHRSFTFQRNIVFWDEGVLLGSKWEGGSENYLLDYNCYWDASGRLVDFAGMTLEQWRAKGMDQHSIIADPKFKNPKKGDFTLAPDSPALALGFKPIDMSKVGPRRR